VLDRHPVRDAGGLRIRDQRSIYATVLDTLQIGQQFDVYYRTVEGDGTPWLWVKSPNNKYGWTREMSDDVLIVGKVDQPLPTAVPTGEAKEPARLEPTSAPTSQPAPPPSDFEFPLQFEPESAPRPVSPLRPELISPYGEPNGPRQRFSEVIAGISFSVGNLPARTITALVTDKASGKPVLLLPGDISPQEGPVLQPDSAHGGTDAGRIGLIDRHVVHETCIAALRSWKESGHSCPSCPMGDL